MEFIADVSRYIDKLHEAIDISFRKWKNRIKEKQVKKRVGLMGCPKPKLLASNGAHICHAI